MLQIPLTLILLCCASLAWGTALTADGFIAQGDADVNWRSDRIGLVNDGSFESGECDDGSDWTCTSNTSCEWIVDPTVTWGYPAHDGVLSAWLGGFCGDEANANSFCQDLVIDASSLEWWWMGFVGDDSGDMVVLSVDGEVVWELILTSEHHTYGHWSSTEDTIGNAELGEYSGQVCNICFEFIPVDGANMLIDYVEINHNSSVEDVSFSTLRTMY